MATLLDLETGCSVDRATLAEKLAQVSRAVSNKTTLPVLQNITLTTFIDPATGAAKMRLGATNLNITIITEFDVSFEPGHVYIATTVPASKINSFVTLTQGAEKVVINYDADTFTLKLQAGRSEAEIKCIDINDYPAIAGIADPDAKAKLTKVADINAAEFTQAITGVTFAASKDETRPVLMGVYCQFTHFPDGEAYLEVACADSFQLATYRASLINGPTNTTIMLPGASDMATLTTLLKGGEDTIIELYVNQNKSQLIAFAPGLVFAGGLIEGNFPPYQQIIPKKYTTRAVTERDSVVKANKLASAFNEDKSHYVMLGFMPGEDLTPGTITLVAQGNEIGKNTSEVDAAVDGGAVSIAFNTTYLNNALAAIHSGQVAFELQTSQTPGVIKPVGKDNQVVVLMPMHLAPR